MADTTNARRSTNLQHALMLAKVGVAVFPSSGKVPLIPLYNRLDTEIGDDDRQQAIDKFKENNDDVTPIHVGATKNPEVVKRMWRANRDAVPSIACGPSRLAVLDADAKDDGPTKLRALFAENEGVPKGTPIIPTKSGGEHFVFKDPEGAFTNRAGLLKKNYGTDVRGRGGQFVAPGSIREDGKTYGTKQDLIAFLRAFAHNTIPAMPAFVTPLIEATANEHDPDEATPSKERDAVKQLIDADWPDFEDIFDPTIGRYDLDAVKAADPDFAELYDDPSADCSTNRFLAARHLMREYPTMPIEDLAVFFEHWQGSGEFVDDKPSSGQYDFRQIAREWLKNQGLSKPSCGNAFGPVVDPDDDDYSKEIAEVRKAEKQPMHAGDIMFMRDFAVYTEPDWIVENTFTPGMLGMIHGASNVGKTFSVIYLGEHIEAGEPWFGRNVMQSGVLYCYGEGHDGLRNRGYAYRQRYKPDGPGMSVHPGIPNLGLDRNAAIVALRRAIKKTVNRRRTLTPYRRPILTPLRGVV